jgi:dynein heavy chain
MWMLEFEDVMKESMREVTAKSIAEYATVSREEWILNWPGQVVIAGSQVYWTKEVTDAIVADGPKGLAAYGEKSNANLTNIVNMVRGELSKLERATMSALVTIDVHARDVVVQMAEDGVSDARDFKWLAQLRYFWEDETLRVRMINAEAQYGFEYLGNSSRLVITPLTDRCYRTLMGAIHLNLGGAPAGPAGTGKTETTKDLSKAIAIQCVVFNCSDGLDYKAMGKFFKGLAASGAWACFDEFNRIELEVLSVVAQQVLCIQRAVAAKVKTFEFEGVELRIIPTANVFITMNPGYAGRSELPDNLKALFRDVAMMVPDYAMIAEIILYSFGYLEARDMARKLVQTYRLCSEQLSSQDHYDYGMRAVISVLRAAGNLKRKFTEEREDVLMLRAITDVNLPKFLDQDVPLFRGILSDLFPGVDLPEIDYDNLLAAMRNNTKKANLQPLPSFEEKIIQLYEMIIVRHGLMIVGESFGMKSSCISVLAGALGELNEKGQNGEQKVKYYCINPKSITMGQLYGAEDPVSKEWADGILAVTFRNAARDTSPDRKWVVFDGPVDAIWIENMNTVLDDNKKLCLNSGEIIAMQGLMNMIFEVADLAVASPATVSRCGMVYVQPSLLGWRPVFLSWLDTLPPTLNEPQKEQITGMFDWLVPPCLRIATKMCKQPQPMQEINLAQSLMRLYESLLDEFRDEEKVAEMNKLLQAVWLDSLFLFALVWSIGASVDQEGRVKFDAMLRQLLAGDVPEELKIWMTAEPRKVTKLIPDANGATVYDFVFDKATGQWAKWTATQEDAPIAEEATYTSIIVPTVDTIRYTYLIDTFVLHQKNFLFVGPTGTGKTAYIKQHVANGIDPEKYSYLFMNFSAQTSANMTQVRPTHWSPYDRVGVVNADP